MLSYVVKRLLVAIPTLLAVLTVVFFFVRIAPGDPAFIILGDQASPQALAAVRHDLGLDKPMPVQYYEFMSTVLAGDLGMSMVTHRPVWGEVANVLPYTIELTLTALVIGVAIGLPLGIAAARHRNRPLDYAARIFSLMGLSFPAFVSAIMLLLAFAIQLHWFPVISEARAGDPWSRLSALVLPAVNLGLIMVAYVTRVARSSMLGVLGEDYIRTARSKGVPARVVIWRHALGNALIPVVTVVGLYLGVLIGNSVLTEIVFNRPGLGKLIVNSLNQRDYTMLEGLMVIYAFIIVIVNLLTDLTYGVVDPRVRQQ
jgi:ABC-type dipeptide/oligopeptide/nickel transport system permease component